MSYVRTGAERLAMDPGLVTGDRLGLITNQTGVLSDLTPTPTVLRGLTALFSPEHGIRGTAQAGFSEGGGECYGLPVHDTYQKTGAELDGLVAASGVDTLVFDLFDVGARFYTYVWTMKDLMESARRLGVGFVVLDRPNPIGGTVAEGPPLDMAFASPVGGAAVPARHGLTVGELARLLDPEVRVITMEGWHRDLPFAETGLPWVMPSVNMPTLDTALVYPGTGLVEGTNLSEGRGTTRPFELVGAPYLDDRFAPALNELGLPGVRFRDLWFTPTFSKHAGAAVRGVQLHVTDPRAFRPVFTAVSLIHVARSQHPEEFATNDFLDHLWGSDTLRRCLEAGQDPRGLCPEPTLPRGELLYR
ncbi:MULTISPECIES: exo-beta-N-acetylmuramidase NamZ family protein [unclassified Nonomuraea]|uniref:exo-beta-N-acetylmuramidase NamZ family protein n=1 Tax=Nonomuraea sp. NPDC003804 TaxID=3154547 RepID=UPI0033A5947E